MRSSTTMRLFGWMGGGAVLLAVGGCLGPNPLFFLGSSAANATVVRLVNTVLDAVLAVE